MDEKSTHGLKYWGEILLGLASGIGSFSAIGYLIVYSYHQGQCFPYQIPPQLIHPDLGTILQFSLAGVVVSSITISCLTQTLINCLKDLIRNKWIKWVSTVLVWIGMLLIWGPFHPHWMFFLVLTPVVTTGVAIGIRACHCRQTDAIPADSQSARKEIWAAVWVFSLALCVILTGAVWYGKDRTETQKNFWVCAAKPELALVQVYGDTGILVPYDAQTKQVHRSFSLIKMNEGKTDQPQFSLQPIGPLKFESSDQTNHVWRIWWAIRHPFEVP